MEDNDNTQSVDDSQGWDDAAADFLEEKGLDSKDYIESDDSESEDDTDETDKSGSDTDVTTDDEDDSADTDEKDEASGDEEESDQDEADDEGESEQEEPPQQNSYREQRQVQRELEADKSSMREDVFKQLYPDYSHEITDADGDPIRTPADVMQRINEATGKAFTAEEAVAWLHSQERHMQSQRQQMESRIEQVSEVNLTIRDDADYVKETHGKFLSENPELRDSIYADYQETLVKDPETGIILNAPISMKKFYERALKPYLDYKTQLESTAQVKQEKVDKAEAQKQRRTQQADRQDITPGSAAKPGSMDPEEDAWASAAQEYYEGK